MMNQKLAAALLLLPLSLTAQDAEASKRHNHAAPAFVSLEFRGGTMARFVAAVREQQPNANIVLASKAEKAVVPPMVLKNADIEQALEGACMVAEADFQVRVKEHRGAGQSVFSIIAYHPPAAPTGNGSARDPIRRVFSLNSLTTEQDGVAGMKVATILSAIDMTVSDSKVPALIRYHQDSGLLLVRGSMNQIRVVEEALHTLEQDNMRRVHSELQRRASKDHQQAPAAGGNGKAKDPK